MGLKPVNPELKKTAIRHLLRKRNIQTVLT